MSRLRQRGCPRLRENQGLTHVVCRLEHRHKRDDNCTRINILNVVDLRVNDIENVLRGVFRTSAESYGERLRAPGPLYHFRHFMERL